MLNSKLAISYYLYVKTNLKSMLLTLICISIFMLHIYTNFKRKIQRLIIIYLICFLLKNSLLRIDFNHQNQFLDYLH